MPETVDVLVRLERGTSMDSMLPAIEATGLRVGRVMARLGVVSGALPTGQLAVLEGLAGVRLVEPDRTVTTAATPLSPGPAAAPAVPGAPTSEPPASG